MSRRALAATLASSLLAVACGPGPEPRPERRLLLRDAGIPIRCAGGALAEFATIEGTRRDWYGFKQAPLSACSFELPVPPDSRLSFRVALSPAARAAGTSARVALHSEVDGVRTPLGVRVLTPQAAAQESVVDLPAGVSKLSFVTASPGRRAKSAEGGAGSVVWGELVITSRGQAEDGLAWVYDPEYALEPFLATRQASASPNRPRLLIVGADGASWQTMERLLEGGEMPNLQALREKGRWGVMRSTIVPESAMGWTALQTGVNAGKSASYSFFNGPSARLSFWDLLGDHGFTSVVVGVPTSWAPRATRGVVISGWAPLPRTAWAQPPELVPLLESAGYSAKLANVRNPRYFAERMRARTDVVRTLLRGMDWDLAFVVYEYTDTVGHRFGLRTKEWDTVYRVFDTELGRLAELLDERTTIMLVSDHGWKRYPASVDLNLWLQRNEFADWKARVPASGETITITRADRPVMLPPLDRSAFPDQIARIRGGLEALTHPSKGWRVVDRIVNTEDAFDGRYVRLSPGRLIVQADERFRLHVGTPLPDVFSGPIDHHSHDGIYLLAGPGAGPGTPGEGDEISIFDVAPTVLAHFGLEPPADSDGVSLIERSGLSALTGRLYTSDAKLAESMTEQDVDPDFMDDLRTLGYIE